MNNSAKIAKFLIDKSASEDVWEEYLELHPPTKEKWLSSANKEAPILFKLMVSAAPFSEKLTNILLEKLGIETWLETVDNKTGFEHLIGRAALKDRTGQAYQPNLVESIVTAIDDQTLNKVISKTHEDAASGIKTLPWAGMSPLYWEGHPLMSCAALCSYEQYNAVIAMGRINPHLHEKHADGHNLANIICNNERGFNAWVAAGLSEDAPIWIDQRGKELNTPIPLRQWLFESGKNYQQLSKEDGKKNATALIEEQIKSKSWRNGAKNKHRDTWINGEGRNILHLLAEHHPASFLTSQAEQENNKKLIGQVDHLNNTCINHLLHGILFNAPENPNKTWQFADSKFFDVANKIEEFLDKNGNTQTNGILAGILKRHSSLSDVKAVLSNWSDNNKNANLWLLSKPERFWSAIGMDETLAMINNTVLMDKISNLWVPQLVGQLNKDSETQHLSQLLPETQITLLAIGLAKSEQQMCKLSSVGRKNLSQLIGRMGDDRINLPTYATKTLFEVIDRTSLKEWVNDHMKSLRVIIGRELLTRINDETIVLNSVKPALPGKPKM